jgi:hypothetical protein
MVKLLKYLCPLAALFCITQVMAQPVRQMIETSNQVDTSDIDEYNQMLLEQNFLEGLFVNRPGITVTPYYDEYGRWGAKVESDDSRPYYVDPYYDDAMTTNRHSDEANTSTNWRVITW